MDSTAAFRSLRWTRRRVLAGTGLAPVALSAGALPTLRMASHALAPYVIEQGEGAPKGALIDFYDQEMGPRMGVRFEWLPCMTLARLMRSLEDGTANATPLLTLTREGLRVLSFASTAYFFFVSVLVLRPEHPLARRALLQTGDLNGMRIGAVQGHPLPPGLEDVAIRWDLAGLRGADSAILTKVARGQIDAGYFATRETPEWMLPQMGLTLRVVTLDVPVRALFAAFGRQSGAAWLGRHERAAQMAFAGGHFESTLRRWFEPARKA